MSKCFFTFDTGYASLYKLPLAIGSELELHPCVHLSASQIIWYGILLIRYISNPVERVDVVDAEQVQTVDAEPDVAEYAFSLLPFVVKQPVAHTDVSPFVCRCPERVAFQFSVWSGERQSVGIGKFK